MGEQIAARQLFFRTLEHMKPNVFTPEGKAMIRDVQETEAQHQILVEKANAMRQANASNTDIFHFMRSEVIPLVERLYSQVDEFAAWEEKLLNDGRSASTAAADSATRLVLVIASFVIVLAVFLAVFLTKLLSRQIGSAVQDVSIAPHSCFGYVLVVTPRSKFRASLTCCLTLAFAAFQPKRPTCVLPSSGSKTMFGTPEMPSLLQSVGSA